MSRVLPVIVAGMLLVGACGSEADDSTTPTSRSGNGSTDSTTSTTSTSVPPDPGEPIVIDWEDPVETSLTNGWTVRECGEGDRVHVCVHDGDELLGDIEVLGGHPVEASDDAAEVALDQARRMVEDFRADRAQGCPDFAYEAVEPSYAVVGGRDGARGGFRLIDGTGTVVEAVVVYFVVVERELTLVHTDAYARSGGCLPPSEIDPSFTPERLAAFEGLLDRIVEGSPVPS